ncbi:hypothetical protein DYB32_005216 [Aphanomyces invadans]|uniref:Uncharacterized protein n=1 Tax=Aphanomyces invadans TaxID=157072 RepID=A0A3R6WLA0_9STRA|nr:hypothetical protein DYB32_005216 [Aphanomyces invadans]
MSQGTTSNAVVEMLAIVDKRLARRRYFRDKQREHRRKVNADVEAAEAELHHVQWVLERLQRARPGVPPKEPSDGPLSWHSIAAVFQREAHRVLTDHQSLATQTQQYKSLATLMQRFVNVNIPVKQLTPTHIVMRYLSHMSHYFRANEGFVSVDEVASLRNIHLTGVADHLKKAHVRRELIRLERAGYLVWQTKILNLLQAS